MEPDDNNNPSPSSIPASAGPSDVGPRDAATLARGSVRYRLWAQAVHTLRVLLFAGVSLAAIGGALLYFLVLPQVPSVDGLQDLRAERPSIILAADGTTLGEFKNRQQEWVGLDRISPHVIDALIATEDRRFYTHHGVDYGRTLAAVLHTAGGDMQGGSTITQQLARNLFPEEIGRSRNVMRKLKEMVTAEAIERHYGKRQILEIYLNTVPFLYNVYGIEMAARTYFDKPAAQLDVLESATLVGMLKGTHYYNPVVNPDRARIRRNVVLNQLLRAGKLSGAQYTALLQRPLDIRFHRQTDQTGVTNHFTEYVRRWAAAWAEAHDVDLYSDGLVLHTTLDPALQKAATDAVERQSRVLQDVVDVEWSQKSPVLLSRSTDAYVAKHRHVEPFHYFWQQRSDLLDALLRDTPQYRKAMQHGGDAHAVLARLKEQHKLVEQLRDAKTRLEAGFVAIDPRSGAVKAWVGSRDFQRDQFDHVSQALRQPGSTFKPLVYGAALEQGYSPNRTYVDAPVEIRSPDGSLWKPTDMEAATNRPWTMRDGLVFSRNTITAQVMEDVGLPQIVRLAKASGIRSRLDAVPSLALGTSPVTLLEMASAYSTIAQEGQYRAPIVVSRITDREGKVVAEFGDAPRPAMSTSTAVELIDMMRGVVARGTGTQIRTRFGINADVAGKTGTTQFNTDGWFIMMHPDLVAGAWVGFNDARVTIRSDYWGQGGHNALLVVGDFFRRALKEKLIDARAKFPRPEPSPVVLEARQVQPDLDAQIGGMDPQQPQILVRRAPDGSTLIGDPQGMAMLMQEQSQTVPSNNPEPSVRRAPSPPVTESLPAFPSPAERSADAGGARNGTPGAPGTPNDPVARARLAARQALDSSGDIAGASGTAGAGGTDAGR